MHIQLEADTPLQAVTPLTAATPLQRQGHKTEKNNLLIGLMFLFLGFRIGDQTKKNHFFWHFRQRTCMFHDNLQKESQQRKNQNQTLVWLSCHRNASSLQHSQRLWLSSTSALPTERRLPLTYLGAQTMSS